VEGEEGKEWDGLAFAFFVKADEAIVGGTKIKALSLSQFEGRAQRVYFKGLEIESEEEMDLKVVPLAGGDFFWGADFLLAFSLRNKGEWFIK
jgi:hypothetical protein